MAAPQPSRSLNSLPIVLVLTRADPVQNLDQIQNSATAHACAFVRSKIDMARDAIQFVIAELEAQAEWDSAD